MQGDPPTTEAAFIDLFASEYGWSIDYIMNLPTDACEELAHAIFWRRGLVCHRRGFGAVEEHTPLADQLRQAFDSKIDTDE